MSESFDWLTERIHDKKHFTARYLAHISNLSGMQPTTIANFFFAFCFVILAFSDQAHFLANILLLGVPLLLIFVYPGERPTDEYFFLYFSVFGGVTVFDRSLENIPLYYVFKVIGFLIFCLQPFDLNVPGNDISQASTALELSLRSTLGSMKLSPKSSESSVRTAVPGSPRSSSQKSCKPVDRIAFPAPQPVSSIPKSSEVKVTVIEEYYREEELLSPNGTLIERIVSGPFRKERVRTESSRSAKSPTK